MIATRDYKQQTHLLEEDDLEVTHACLKAWEAQMDGETTTRRLFAFFNSGRFSGASQAHRHVQFLPVEEMAEVSSDGGWRPLIDLMGEGTSRGRLSRSLSLEMAFSPFGPKKSRITLGYAQLCLFNNASCVRVGPALGEAAEKRSANALAYIRCDVRDC